MDKFMYKFETWFSVKYPELYTEYRKKSKGKRWMLWEWLKKEHSALLDEWENDARIVARIPVDKIAAVIRPVRVDLQVS